MPPSFALKQSLTSSSLGLTETEVLVRDGNVSFLAGVTLSLPYKAQVLPGSSIGVNTTGSLGNAGTLGGYVKLTRDGRSKVFGLTNHHVVAGMRICRNAFLS